MYAYERRTKKAFADAETALRASLKTRGFGILTEIDVQKTLKEKLGIDMEPYRILGACNPKFAHQAIGQEPNLGVLLPCNVIVRREGGETVVAAVLPSVQLGKVGNPALTPIADAVERLLKEAVEEAI